MPKYSIIVPVHNGMPYVQSCLETILSQAYGDYELIVSNDHSTDGSTELLRGIHHANMVLLEPPQRLSMTEHWEWALSHARGDWQMFLGQDDGLQKHFFHLADRLTGVAETRGCRAVAARRAYFFWPGCESSYGDRRVGYFAERKIRTRSVMLDEMKALLGGMAYHHLPQMYTSSLFHRSLLDEARRRQDGSVFSCHPQDANLAAIACGLERRYVRSEIPLAWVGSSPKSAGLAISSESKDGNEAVMVELKELRQEYKKKISESRFAYNRLAGDFSFANTSVYFWQALLETANLRPPWKSALLRSKFFRAILFSSVWAHVKNARDGNSKSAMFMDILRVNDLPHGWIAALSSVFRLILVLSKAVSFLMIRVPRKIIKVIFRKGVDYTVESSSNEEPDLLAVTEEIARLVESKGWLQKPLS